MVLPTDLSLLLEDLRRAAVRVTTRERRRRRLIMAGAALLALTACAGVGAATVSLLGGAAPPRVQTDLHRAARFMWAGHSLLQSQTAVAVAKARDATLYSVRDDHGNYCAELVGTGEAVIFGFTCNLSKRAANGELLSDAAGTSVQYAVGRYGGTAPAVQFGRLPLRAVAARAVFDDGVVERIPIGLDGFYVYEPAARNQARAHRLATTLQFLDSTGRPIWSYYVQPAQPLRVEGVGPHLISGRVVIKGANRVKVNVSPYLSAPSTIVFVPIHQDGSFRWVGRPGARVYNVTVVDREGLSISADAQPLSAAELREITALSTR